MKHLRLSILLCLALCATAVSAQKLLWGVDFNAIFENREGDGAYSENQTIIFTRLTPTIGIDVMDGMHQIRGGVAWNQPMGNGWRGYKLCPTLYYSFHSRNSKFNLHIGMLPRTLLAENAPKFIWCDSINYQQPNIRGLLFQYVRPAGYMELALDWRQLQTETQREAFNVNINSRWHPGHQRIVSIGEFAQINHLAKQKNAPEDQFVNDDISFNPYVAVNLSHITPLDSLSFRVGAAVQLERARQLDKWQNAAGFLTEICAEWKWIGLRETLYAGQNLMPLYPYLGSQLNMGDPQYQSTFYSRTDLYAHVFANQFVDLEAGLNFHVTAHNFDFWQRIAVHFYIDQALWQRRKEIGKKGARLRNFY